MEFCNEIERQQMNHKFLCFLILVGCISESQETAKPPTLALEIWFEDQAALRGVAIPWMSGDTGKFNMPEIIGGGAAFIDIDNDGDLDLYFIQGGYLDDSTTEPNRLFRNDGDGYFVDITLQSNAGDTGYGMGVTTGDYDNDGWTDIYVTNVGRNTLLRNNGDGTFEDATLQAGVGDLGWGASTAFADFDADGDLDLYVINYLNWEFGLDLDCFNSKGALDYCSPTNYMAPARDVLYKNNGDGTFTDVTEQAGIGSRVGTGLGILCNDFTGDGLIDIFVANDGMADQLWENQGNFTFIDVALIRGCALDNEGQAKAGMGVTSEDIDGDGDFDILVCNLFGESDSLFRNDGGYFTDITASKGIRTSTRHATRFGLGLVDFNNDGSFDLFEANGRVQRIGESLTNDPFAEPNYVLKGNRFGFERIEVQENPSIHTSRAAVFGDVDNDGGIDVFVVNRDAPSYLLMNVHPDRKNSVTLNILNSYGSPALGAVLTGTIDGKKFTKSVQSAWSYMAANDPRVYIGLGKSSTVDNLMVRWIDGSISHFGGFTRGTHTMKQP